MICAKILRKKLRLSGYEADTCGDGEAALELLAVERYDLVLLDLNLPKVDGRRPFCELPAGARSETGVLILSARSEISDKVEGLDAGANDYLAKPFHLAELEARVRSLTRRRFVQQDVCLRCGGLTFDTRSRAPLRRTDRPLSLTRKESGILEYLLLNRGRPVSQEELIEHVWDSSVDSFSNSIRVHISTLRKSCARHWDTTRSAIRSDRATRSERANEQTNLCAVAHHDLDCAAHRGGVREPESAAAFYSGSGSMDALNGFVVEYKTENQQAMTIEIPKENMQAFFSDFLSRSMKKRCVSSAWAGASPHW